MSVTGARPVAAGVLSAAAVGTVFAWSVVAAPIGRDLQISAQATAAIFAAGLAAFTLSMLLLGPAVDRAGPRRALRLLAVVAGAGLLLAAAARSGLLLGVAVAGVFSIAAGAGYAVATGLAARLAPPGRARAMGFVVAGYAAGPVILGLTGPPLVAAAGWRSCVAGLAAIVTGLMLLAARCAPPVWPEPATAAGFAAAGRTARGGTALLWVLMACGTTPALITFAHALPIATEAGLPPRVAGLGLSMLAAGNFAGRLLAGLLATRTGVRAALGLALATTTAALTALGFGTGALVVIIALAGLGAGYGAVSALVPAATAELSPASGFGRSYGRVFSGWGLAGLLAPVGAAYLADSYGGYTAALRYSAIAVLAAAVALVLLCRRHGQCPRPRRNTIPTDDDSS